MKIVVVVILLWVTVLLGLLLRTSLKKSKKSIAVMSGISILIMLIAIINVMIGNSY